MRYPLVVRVRSLVSALLTIVLLVAGVAGVAAESGVVPEGADAAEVRLTPTSLVGVDRVQTSASAALAWAQAGGRANRVVVVPAGLPRVALLAAPLAASLGTVVLLTDSTLAPVTRDAVEAIGGTSILLLTDDVPREDGAVDDDDPDGSAGNHMADAWRAEGLDVEVLAIGPGLVDGGAVLGQAVTDAAGHVSGEGIVVAGLQADGDLMAAAVLASRRRVPLLLTGGALPADVTDLLAARADAGQPILEATIVGGPAVVPTSVEHELRDTGLTVDRLAGADRGATSVVVASHLQEDSGTDTGSSVLLLGQEGVVDAAAATGLADALNAVTLIASPSAEAWLGARCGAGMTLTTVGGDAVLPGEQANRHRRAAQHCHQDRVMRVPIAVVAVRPDGQPTADADAIIAEVVAAATGPSGWSHGRVQLVLDTPHQVGIILATDGCGGAALCRIGRDLVIDLDAWRAAVTTRRQRLVDLAVGHWLGQATANSCDTTAMAPLTCPDVPISANDREEVSARFSPSITLAFGGDIHAERHLAGRFSGTDNPLAPVQHLLEPADIAIVNLETPLSTRGSAASKTYTFRGPPATARALADVGVDVVTLANNHALDYGSQALADTLVHTADAGLGAVGAGPDAAAAYTPHIIQTEVGTVAIVGLTRVLHTLAWEATANRAGLASAYDVPAATAAVRAADQMADHVVVAIHWGTERAICPDANQRALAPALVDAGADLIVGHHPHVLQGVQQHDGALIAYSLGNFVWYHNSAPSRYTGVLEVRLPLLAEPDWTFTPAEINGVGSPVPSTGASAAAISGIVRDRSPGGAARCAFPAS